MAAPSFEVEGRMTVGLWRTTTAAVIQATGRVRWLAALRTADEHRSRKLRQPTWAERAAAASGQTPELCRAGAVSSGRVRAGALTLPLPVPCSSRSLGTRETRRDRRYQSQSGRAAACLHRETGLADRRPCCSGP